MKDKQEEIKQFHIEAELLRKEADLNCIFGRAQWELRGLNKYSKHKELLKRAEEKIHNTVKRENDIQDLNRSIKTDEQNNSRLCDQMLVKACWRGELERYI